MPISIYAYRGQKEKVEDIIKNRELDLVSYQYFEILKHDSYAPLFTPAKRHESLTIFAVPPLTLNPL
jgi:hypothetical protein